MNFKITRNVPSLQSNFSKIFFVLGCIYNPEFPKVLIRIEGYHMLFNNKNF